MEPSADWRITALLDCPCSASKKKGSKTESNAGKSLARKLLQIILAAGVVAAATSCILLRCDADYLPTAQL